MVGDVLGVGLMLGLEIVSDKTSKTSSPLHATAISQHCRDASFLLGHRPTGAVSGNVIRILPPSFLPARRPTGRSPFWKRRFQNRRYQRNRLDAVIKLGGRCLDVRTGPANLQPKVRSLNRRVADFMSNPQFLRPRAPTSGQRLRWPVTSWRHS